MISGSCIRRCRAETDGTKKRDQSLIALEKLLSFMEYKIIFGRNISYSVFTDIKVAIKSCEQVDKK